MRYAANQEVIYVGPDFRQHRLILSLGITAPVPGRVYTIRDWRDIGPGPFRHTTGWHYLVNEIVNRVRNTLDLGMAEQSWIPHVWLRPVQKRAARTDISELLKLQDPVNHKELEGV